MRQVPISPVTGITRFSRALGNRAPGFIFNGGLRAAGRSARARVLRANATGATVTFAPALSTRITVSGDKTGNGNYGGPTQTMPPLTGSSGIDPSPSASSLAYDQRGYPQSTTATSNDSPSSMRTEPREAHSIDWRPSCSLWKDPRDPARRVRGGALRICSKDVLRRQDPFFAGLEIRVRISALHSGRVSLNSAAT